MLSSCEFLIRSGDSLLLEKNEHAVEREEGSVRVFPVCPLLREVSERFIRAGFCIYVVGGAVRDFLLNRSAHDWDLATDAPPERVRMLFRRTVPTGIEHGTVTILFRGHSIECTTFRVESDYSDRRHPDSVCFAARIEDDLARRDFTVNAFAAALPSGEIIDVCGGYADLRNGLICSVGDAHARFSEDALRPLRAVRFAAQLSFSIEARTREAIIALRAHTARISRERVRDELSKMLCTPRPSIALRLMEETGLLHTLFPALAQVCGRNEGEEKETQDSLQVSPQQRRDARTFAACAFAACDRVPAELAVRLAALLFPLAHYRTLPASGTGAALFICPPALAEARELLRGLKYPNYLTAQVCHLVAHARFTPHECWSEGTLRRFVVTVGTTKLESLCVLRRAYLADDDYRISAQPGVSCENAREGKKMQEQFEIFVTRVRRVAAQLPVHGIRDLAVNGRDLIAQGIPPGPTIGHILNALFDMVLMQPSRNTRPQLLEHAQEIVRTMAQN